MKPLLLLFACLGLGVLAGDLRDKREWGNTGGGTLRGAYVRHENDTLELKDDAGKLIKIDINALCLEDVRLLYPTVSYGEFEKPPQARGLYNSKVAKEKLLRRTRFFDFGGGKYGRLYAHGFGSVYFQNPSGGLFGLELADQGGIRGFSDYINFCMAQIPPELNAFRMRELAPWIQSQKIAALERRVRGAEQSAAAAQAATADLKRRVQNAENETR